MSDLKRHPIHTADGLSIMSPFHKEMKRDNTSYPGQQYSEQMSKNPDLLIRQNYLDHQEQISRTKLTEQKSAQQISNSANYLLSTPFFSQPLDKSLQGIASDTSLLKATTTTTTTTRISSSAQQAIQTSPFDINALNQTQSQHSSNSSAPQISTTLTPAARKTSNNESDEQCDSSHETSSRKSEERNLLDFETFIRQTADISNGDLNFEYASSLYTIKIDQILPNSELQEIHSKLSSKQGFSKPQSKKNWNDFEINFLVSVILKLSAYRHSSFHQINEHTWEEISSMLIGRTTDQCRFKWLSLSRQNLQQQPWSEEEDTALVQIIKKYEAKNRGNKWSEIAAALNQVTLKHVFRQGKQCRERWNNHLDPSINRGPWTADEELIILKLVLQKGKHWSDIAKSTGTSRTENAVKNRFNSLIRREKTSSSSTTNPDRLDSTSSILEQHPSDLPEEEQTRIITLIERIEARLKIGFSLFGGGSIPPTTRNYTRKANTKSISEVGLEEEQEVEEEEAEQTGIEERNSSEIQKAEITMDEEDIQNNNNNKFCDHSSISTLSSIMAHQKSEDSEFSQLNQQMSRIQLFSNTRKSKRKTTPKETKTPNPTQNQQQKTVKQSKQSLFELVSNEVKINLDSSTLNIPSKPPTLQLFHNNPTQQEPDQSPSAQQDPHSHNQQSQHLDDQHLQPSESNPSDQDIQEQERSRLPSIPLVDCGYLRCDDYTSPSHAQVNKHTNRMDMKKDEFESLLQHQQQLVFVNKATNELFLVTPAFMQQKISSEFHRNINVLNTLQSEQIATPSGISAATAAGCSSSTNHHHISQYYSSQQYQQQQQQQQHQQLFHHNASAAGAGAGAGATPAYSHHTPPMQSFSMFINQSSPLQQKQHYLHQSQSQQQQQQQQQQQPHQFSGNTFSPIHLNLATSSTPMSAAGVGDITPSIYSYYQNTFTSSPSRYFIQQQYSNQNTPSSHNLGLNSFSQSQMMHPSSSLNHPYNHHHSQQHLSACSENRMINQMPLPYHMFPTASTASPQHEGSCVSSSLLNELNDSAPATASASGSNNNNNTTNNNNDNEDDNQKSNTQHNKNKQHHPNTSEQQQQLHSQQPMSSNDIDHHHLYTPHLQNLLSSPSNHFHTSLLHE